jgi:hypothetical protein
MSARTRALGAIGLPVAASWIVVARSPTRRTTGGTAIDAMSTADAA